MLALLHYVLDYYVKDCDNNINQLFLFSSNGGKLELKKVLVCFFIAEAHFGKKNRANWLNT